MSTTTALPPAPAARPGDPDHPDRIDVAALVEELAAAPSTWAPLAQHHPDRRWWTRLVATDQVDVWLITWPPGGTTDLHDHGTSTAAFSVVEGVLEEVRSDRTGHLTGTRLEAGQTGRVEPGAVHDVRNPGGTAAVSIHAYAPPLTRMTYYEAGPAGLEPVRSVDSDEPEVAQSW